MDISDVEYDAFLINGWSTTLHLSHAKPGTRIKLRIINAGASSHFILEYSGGNDHQLTDHLSFDWKWTDKEYIFEIHYGLTKQFYISGNYDSRERFGIGLSLKF